MSIVYSSMIQKKSGGFYMKALEVTTLNFEEEVLKADKPVLLDFWASWCGPCKMLSPIVEEIAEAYDDIKVGKVNVDEQSELAQQYKIMSIPTLLIFKDGKLKETSIGVKSKTDILTLLNKYK